MQKSKIEWTEYTSNPVKGKCPMGCPYCYAEAIRRRFHKPEEITFHPEELEAIKRHKKPARIFMGSAIELFHHDTIGYLPYIMETVRECPQHTFIFLTKCPQNLPRKWPYNCWVGTSADGVNGYFKAIHWSDEYEANVKFISFEPLLENPLVDVSDLIYGKFNWVIIGAQTPYRKKTAPKIEWVKEIVENADDGGIPVFFKDNLLPVFEGKEYHFMVGRNNKPGELRQELPVKALVTQ